MCGAVHVKLAYKSELCGTWRSSLHGGQTESHQNYIGEAQIEEIIHTKIVDFAFLGNIIVQTFLRG